MLWLNVSVFCLQESRSHTVWLYYGCSLYPLSVAPCVLLSHTLSYFFLLIPLPSQVHLWYRKLTQFSIYVRLIYEDCKSLCLCILFLPFFSVWPSSPIILILTSNLSPYVIALYVNNLLSLCVRPLLQAGTMAVWAGNRRKLSCSAAGKPASWWGTANQEPASTPSLWSEFTDVCISFEGFCWWAR